MTALATLTRENILELPAEIAQYFQPTDRFIIWRDGDSLHLKRIQPSPLKKVATAPEGEPMSFDEIDDIVHEVRQRRPKM